MAHVHALSICLPWIRHEAGDVDGQAIDPILDVRSCVQDHHLELPPTGRPVPGSDTVSHVLPGTTYPDRFLSRICREGRSKSRCNPKSCCFELLLQNASLDGLQCRTAIQCRKHDSKALVQTVVGMTRGPVQLCYAAEPGLASGPTGRACVLQ